jgi:DNA-binding response OmpR family regulator
VFSRQCLSTSSPALKLVVHSASQRKYVVPPHLFEQLNTSNDLSFVENHIAKLRHKLEACSANPRHILTIHRVGYKFVR